MAEKRKRLAHTDKDIVITIPAIKAPGWLQGFVDFIREQGVVGLAVGFILGVGAKTVVDSLVNNVFNPVIGVLYGGGGALATKYWCLKEVGGACTNQLGYGAFLNSLISFTITAFLVYFIIKGLKLDKLNKKEKK